MLSMLAARSFAAPPTGASVRPALLAAAMTAAVALIGLAGAPAPAQETACPTSVPRPAP
jgi:hypothetical protein